MKVTMLQMVVVLLLFCGCSDQQQTDFTALSGTSAESQWELVLEGNGSATTFTAALAIGIDGDQTGRLYILTPYGQTIAKCVLDKGSARCEPAPGAGPLVAKTAVPFGKLIEAYANAGHIGVFTDEHAEPTALHGKGWQAEISMPWLVYKENTASWRLKLKRTQ